MLGTRILVIFSEFSDADSLVDTLLSALSRAMRPFGMRFALPKALEVTFDQLPSDVLGRVAAQESILFYDEAAGPQGVLPYFSDETHFLLIKGVHRFAEKWDQGLLSRHRKVSRVNPAILTSMASEEEEGLRTQAFLPALAEEFAQDAVKLAKGLPLVCGASPVRTLIVNPALVFGKTDFLRQAETKDTLLSIAAFVAGYHVYALETPLIWPLTRPRTYWLEKPSPDTLPRTNLTRFEQSAGFSFEKHRVGVRTTLGLFSTEDGYPQKMSVKLEVKARARAMLARATHPMPMFVTAFYELPEALKPTLSYLIRFSYLKGLDKLPLLLYAGGRQERILRANFPNTFSYPDNALLPKSLLLEGMTATQHFKRNKILLLQRSMNTYPGFSHYSWVDFDIMGHPIPAQAMPNFSMLMDETVHLATVNGEPDGSLIMVPRQHMKLLAREVNALSQVDAAIHRSFSETAMLLRLIEKFPDLFTLHPMPEKHLLFWTGFDPQLLSEQTNALLLALPPAVRGEPLQRKER